MKKRIWEGIEFKQGTAFFIAILLLTLPGFGQYNLQLVRVDQDSLNLGKPAGIQTSFKTRAACAAYLNGLPESLQVKGFPAASVDSVYYDSTSATAFLFLGAPFDIAILNTEGLDQKMLEHTGLLGRNLEKRPLEFKELQALQQKVLDFMENNGYPFAKLRLDSITFKEGRIAGRLALDKGRSYTVDSIRVYGPARISNIFLQRYLEIKNGSIYQKSKLENISKKMMELPYLQEQQPWNMTMLGTGSILNFYLKPKKSSQLNVLLGFLPSNDQLVKNKLLLTGEANINLQNALGNGESIGFNWQQVQVKSPRLNLSFQQPYLFGSPVGISTNFDLFKKDSSYLNLSFILGMQYALPRNQTGRIFIQSLQSNLLSIDTIQLKASKKLPPEIDVRSVNLGVDYAVNNTNYRFNPVRGSELQLTVSAGTRRIKKNTVIVKLYDPAFAYGSLYDTVQQNSYQFRMKGYANHFFAVGKQSTVKTAFSGGWFQSPKVYRNELFQIGGYKLLRGFDEESIFAAAYGVATVEYRYLIGLNSYLFAFVDAGRVGSKVNNKSVANSYMGTGLGLAFETKAGIFNISYAAGKRDDSPLNLRQSKIHLGYVSFF